MPLQAFPQTKIPPKPVRGYLMRFNHLWLNRPFGIHGVEHIKNMQTKCSGNGGGNEMGIEYRYLGFQDNIHGLAGLGLSWAD
jgi:hypothetical protein